jgi:hypothetical protein
MPSRVSSKTGAAGLRELLIAQQERAYGPGGRWHIPGHRYEFLEALRAGEPVMVSAAWLESVLPGRRFRSGRDDEYLELDEFDELREVDG